MAFRTISKEVIDQILPLYKSGLTMEEVASRLGLSRSSVSRHVAIDGYDRTHVGGKLAKITPIANEGTPNPRPKMRTISRTLKMQSDDTGIVYTIGTDSDVCVIESDSALMELRIDKIRSFISELESLLELLKSPS